MTAVPATTADGRRISAYAAGISAALFAFAFIAAPHSCEWGLAAYVWLGFAALAALFTGPFVFHRDRSLTRRIVLALGFFALGLAVWIAGLFAANVRLLCRLF